MPPYLLLNDTNAVKRLILEQAKQIECLKSQLEQYRRDASTASAPASSSSIVCNTSASPIPIISDTMNDSVINDAYEEPATPSINHSQLILPTVLIKSEDQSDSPSASSSTPQTRRVSPLQKTRPTPKKGLKLNQLPSKRTFKKRIKAAIELDGYNRDAHFQHLIYQDSALPSRTKNARWNFAFRFCSYFVLSGRKIFVKTLTHGNKQNKKKPFIDLLPGLHEFLRLKRIDAALLEKPLAEETVAHFTTTKHQLEIVKFLYAFCSLLYTFLPQEKRFYKARGSISDFLLSAIAEEEDEAEIKVEMDNSELKLV